MRPGPQRPVSRMGGTVTTRTRASARRASGRPAVDGGPDEQPPEWPGEPAGGPRFPGMTVQGWFAVVFAGFALLVIAAAVVIAQLLAQGRAVSADLVGGILPAQAQAYRLQGALVDQETGVRGYGITGRADFLQPYTAGLATQADAAIRLRRLIGADPLLAADLRGVEAAASHWRRSYATPLIALARHGPLDGRDLGLLDASKHSFDHLRALFAAQNAHLAAAAYRDSDRLGSDRSINDWAFGAVLAVFLIASAARCSSASGPILA